MPTDILQSIQQCQFTDKSGAEVLLLSFIRETFLLQVQSVELRPLAVSLNSFNGYLTLEDGTQLFFKTHTESDTVINEYYQAELLAQAGYPVIQPIFRSTEAGKQLLIYDLIRDPSVFDVAWDIENEPSGGFEAVAQAQHQADDQLARLYRRTLAWQSAEDAAQSAVHQLFYHRVTGGRLARFYGPWLDTSTPDVVLSLPDGRHSMRQLGDIRWVINGQHYSLTLHDLMQQCIQLLHPGQAGPAIIGHGDAHNGNVFLHNASTPDASFLYFDPAFAGQHHPLLDLVKPLFHNVFAMWLYFPDIKRDQTTITYHIDANTCHVYHDYTLHPVRQMFFHSKIQRVLIPVLRELRRQQHLRPDWRAYLKSALFCCAFLTMNLADQTKFPPEISLLGFAMSVEMGAESHGKRSLLDHTLDQVEHTFSCP